MGRGEGEQVDRTLGPRTQCLGGLPGCGLCELGDLSLTMSSHGHQGRLQIQGIKCRTHN